MTPWFKEFIKYCLFTLFCVGLVLLACFLVLPYSQFMDKMRQTDVVRALVPGEPVFQPIRVGDESGEISVYRFKNDVAVVFVPVRLFTRDVNLAMRLDGSKVVTMVDVDLGLTPVNPGLRGILAFPPSGDPGSLREMVAQAAPDVMGGATVDYSRLSALLERVVNLVQKAGSK